MSETCCPFRVERDMRQPTIEWLRGRGFVTTAERMIYGYVDVVAARYGKRPSPGRKPPLLETIAVELKMSDVAGVIKQASDNRNAVDWSYCAMPASRIDKMRPATLERFREAGVGLLSLDADGVSVAIEPSRGQGMDGSPAVAARIWRAVRKQYDERGTNQNR